MPIWTNRKQTDAIPTISTIPFSLVFISLLEFLLFVCFGFVICSAVFLKANIVCVFSLRFVFITELKAVVLGTADLYVKTGSDINLTCKISKGPHELGTVFWYKGEQITCTTHTQTNTYFN